MVEREQIDTYKIWNACKEIKKKCVHCQMWFQKVIRLCLPNLTLVVHPSGITSLGREIRGS